MRAETRVEGRPARAAARLAIAVTACLLAAGAVLAQPKPAALAACAACHGPGGNAPVAQFPSIAGQPKVFIENQLVLIREGLRDVPAMKAVMAGMSDQDIVALAEHFSAQPLAPRPAPAEPEKYRLGADISRKALCGTCHLPGYVGQKQVPRLAGQNEPYLVQSMKEFRDSPGPGRDTIMAAVLQGMSDADLANLAHYFAGFKP